MKKRVFNDNMLRYYQDLLNVNMVERIKELWIDKKLALDELYFEITKDYKELIIHTWIYQKHKPLDFHTQGYVLITAAMLYYKDYDVSEWIRYKKKYMESEEEQRAFEDLHKDLPPLPNL